MEALAQVPAVEWLTAVSSVAGPIAAAYALRFLIKRRALARAVRRSSRS